MKSVRIIPSKSDAHRAYIASALSYIGEVCGAESGKHTAADFLSCVKCDETSDDIEATKNCLAAIIENGHSPAGVDLYCAESGSTLRFLLPIVGALGLRGIFHPEGNLSKRPLSPLYEELIAHGMSISEPGSLPLIAEGKLSPGTFRIPGNISSQFITGLLFALPLLDGESEILVEGELESALYVDMTIRTLNAFGITIKEEELCTEVRGEDSESIKSSEGKKYYVSGNQKYKAPSEYMVEGDWSNAAFWFVIGAIGPEPIRVEGLNLDSAQGDKHIMDVLKKMGANIGIGESSEKTGFGGTEGFIEVMPSRNKLKGITFDVKETPDMVPAISLLGAFAKGKTRIVNARRLRLKESDRLHTVKENLRAMGVRVEELEDGLIIYGQEKISGCQVSGHKDHRIVMMAAAAGAALTGSDEKIEILGSDAVNKSYPSFFKILSELELDNNLELL